MTGAQLLCIILFTPFITAVWMCDIASLAKQDLPPHTHTQAQSIYQSVYHEAAISRPLPHLTDRRKGTKNVRVGYVGIIVLIKAASFRGKPSCNL